MQNWWALVFGALAIGSCVAIVGVRPQKGGATAAASASASASASAGPSDAGPAAAAAGDASAEPVREVEFGVGDINLGPTDAGTTLLDGSAPSGLPGDAPKMVKFGVILVQYKSAQMAPGITRTREQALTLAQQLAEEAKTNFKAAVAKGDPGSMENAGQMPRGMLEPAPEFVLFSLPKDGVSDPVDTPRGFWIVHRIE
jgi:hypothetical protein